MSEGKRERGCRYIGGSPADALTLGEKIFCNRPVALGSSWCDLHRRIIFLQAPDTSKHE